MRLRALFGLALGLAGCPVAPARAEPPEVGVASWYGPRHHGRRMASGARFDQWGANAAHRTLPLGTRATVTDLATGRSARIVIEDRGPYVAGRVLDLSRGTARAIGMEARGTGLVRLTVEGGPVTIPRTLATLWRTTANHGEPRRSMAKRRR